ncbi:DUF488 domain-containing protein [Candidatus Nitrosocosmicus agrestis]|uniref:DUF488 domain-containing protein n=1 Tax=Candidatus Nitrosocosmicus agrestis TaxID=2563600 RepID=UPI00122E87BA|nr:DUF488 family protein [Candidatus Nitrosocosmicus sp. SS]KAA2280315.1 DUF488 family protein [Candidatus Nitrosocosmicus sp. SS]KAF0867758.1 DUF488 family protein [Candidatus Nitrosocosmicus sp. SS]MDR4491580.1 DUF488 family protein [Candidatus Nitrosocosmicus sp.]
MIKIERIYDNPIGKSGNQNDGLRILVDRLWPRGLSKNEVKVDLWMKDLAPSTPLRKWFNHDERKWEQFKSKYFEELDKCNESINVILTKLEKGSVILLYGAKDEKFNNAIALKEYIESFKK